MNRFAKHTFTGRGRGLFVQAMRAACLVVVALFAAGLAHASPQMNETVPQTPVKTTTETGSSQSNGANTPADDNNKELLAANQREVERLTKEAELSKQLYDEGLISRVELEASDKSLAEARSKMEDFARQLADNKTKIPEKTSSFAPATAQAWTTGDNQIDTLIQYYGNEFSVDPYLIYCVMSQESRFHTSATSPKGARGLMQLMPATAARYGVSNPNSAAQNIMGGAHYLKDLSELFNGKLELVLAGYNAGENAVIKFGYAIPPYSETQQYVRLISERYRAKTS
jgi:soluble lytic murein transglycosylase-like protein